MPRARVPFSGPPLSLRPSIFRLTPALVLAGLLLSPWAASQAQATSFDCTRAATATEKTLCSDPVLGALDRRVSDHYLRLRDSAPRTLASSARTAQRAWLRTRDACRSDVACLTDTMDTRARQLGHEADEVEAALDATIARIADEPAAAAQILRTYDGGLASAWLMYLGHFRPDASISRDELHQRRTQAAATLRDSFVRNLLRDLEMDPDSDQGVLTLLRMQVEQAGYAREGARPYVHCFVFDRHEASFDAFGALYGSSRDSAAPVCAPRPGLFDHAGWAPLQQLFAPLVAQTDRNSGTIRYAFHATWRTHNLRATVMPALYLNGNVDPTPPRWAEVLGAEAIAAAPAAVAQARQATAAWLQANHGYNAHAARQAATAIVNEWLDDRLEYLSGS